MAISGPVVKCLQETYLLFTEAASYSLGQKGWLIQKTLDTNPASNRPTAATAGTEDSRGKETTA